MAKQFYINALDQNRFIKVNDSTKEVTNPALFNSNNGPTADGLLSNTLFGITMAERSGIYGYINLSEKFINPYFYKIWNKIDKNLKPCVYETDTFIINKQGYLEQNDNGETGLKFLAKNINNLKFKDNGWFIISDKIEGVCDGAKDMLKYQPEKIGEYYVQNINEYYHYLLNSGREKDKLRIPIVEDYIKSLKK